MEPFVGDGNNVFGGYFNLLYQACRLYEGFNEYLYDAFFKEYGFIKAVVQHAIESKEIRPLDADVVAHHIRYIFIGYTFEESFNGDFSIKDAELFLMSYYAYIKA